MSVGRERRCGVGLAEKVEGNLGLREEFVPQFERKIIRYPFKCAEKCALKLRMATLAALWQCQPGGTSSSVIL